MFRHLPEILIMFILLIIPMLLLNSAVEIIFAEIILVHGMLYILRFIDKSVRIVPAPVEIIFIASGLILTVGAYLFMFDYQYWWLILFTSALISLVTAFKYRNAAPFIKYTNIFNIFILITAVFSFAIWDFNMSAQNELKMFLSAVNYDKKILTKEMTAQLPPVIQKWLVRSNAVGKEIIKTAYLTQAGEMRTAFDGGWMPFAASQWITTENPGFIWLVSVNAAPAVKLVGIDKYKDGKGSMLIKLLGLFKVADSGGKEIDQGAMIRYLAEIIWTPTAAANDYIKWEQLDNSSVKATMTYGGISASGIFKFDENGDIASFEAKRYYDRKTGATLEDWFIKIDRESYKNFDGIRTAAKSAITWKLKDGDFNWYKLEILDIKYNQLINY